MAAGCKGKRLSRQKVGSGRFRQGNPPDLSIVYLELKHIIYAVVAAGDETCLIGPCCLGQDERTAARYLIITEGSIRIGSSCYCDQLDTAAYRTPDGNKLLTLFNKNAKALPVTVRMNGRGAQLPGPGNTVISCTIEGD